MTTRTRYVYDTEFIETGREVFLISIGIVCEDGREYYAVNSHMPLDDKIAENDFLMREVVPYLPIEISVDADLKVILTLDFMAEEVKPPTVIASEVLAFLKAGEHEPELWAYYSAHDHVLFSRLWGDFDSRPPIVPMRTNDIAQEIDAWNASATMPAQHEDNHHALADARHGLKLLRHAGYARDEWVLTSAIEHFQKYPRLFPGTKEWRREREAQLPTPERP